MAETKSSNKMGKIKPREITIEPGEVCAILEMTLTDKNGKVVEHRRIKSKSFVRQFLELFYIQGSQVDSLADLWFTIRDTGNTLRNVPASSAMLTAVASAGTATRGIVVGTDNTSVTINDYKLGAQINHGTGAGQLQYGGMTFAAPSIVGSISEYMLTRPFSNASGGGITIKEIGVYVGSDGYNFMDIRDVISPTITVPDGQTLTINYLVMASI
jgi:hypothetical protein